MTALHKLSPRERRIETGAETSARIAAGQAEARRINCPYPNNIYRCEPCGEDEFGTHGSYPISIPCPSCGELLDAQDNPARKAWFEGFARAEELLGLRASFLTDRLHGEAAQ